jgi:hypothetical protein
MECIEISACRGKSFKVMSTAVKCGIVSVDAGR